MAEPARRMMTEDEFLLWCLDQEERYELENGFPVRMMRDGAIRAERPQRRADEYRQRAGLNYILLVESERVEALLLRRASDDAPWEDADFEGRDAVVELPTIGCRLPLSEVYDGVVFDDV
jgi:Uma2 family endonuclease